MNKIIIGFILVMYGAMFIANTSSCSGGAGEAKSAMRTYVEQSSRGNARLVSFSQTGSETHRNGRNKAVQYTITVEYVNSCYVSSVEDFSTLSSCQRGRDYFGFACKQVQAGQRAKFTGQLFFQKTDNGWREAGYENHKRTIL